MSIWTQDGKDFIEILDNFHHVVYMVTKDRIGIYADYLEKYTHSHMSSIFKMLIKGQCFIDSDWNKPSGKGTRKYMAKRL